MSCCCEFPSLFLNVPLFLFHSVQSNLNEEMLSKIGGIKSLETKLKTSFKKGLKGDEKDLLERIKLYGKNEVSV